MTANLTHTNPSNHVIYEYAENSDSGRSVILHAHVKSYFNDAQGWTQTICQLSTGPRRIADWPNGRLRFSGPQRVLKTPNADNLETLAMLYPSRGDREVVPPCPDCLAALRDHARYQEEDR